jgi:ATP-binding cassette, subfamily B, bacterial
MASSMDERPTNGNDRPRWQRFAGKRVDVLVPAGSGIVSRAEEVVHTADRVVVMLEQMLEPASTRDAHRIEIQMVESGGSAPVPPGTERDAQHESGDNGPIVITADGDVPGAAYVDAMVRALVKRWYGSSALDAEVIVAGLCSIVSGRVNKLPTVDQAHARVREALRARRPVSIFPLSSVDPDDPDRVAVATSFVAFLSDTYGAMSIGQFLSAFDPARIDAGAQSVFFRPLGALEESWYGSMQHRAARGGSFRLLMGRLIPLLRPNSLRGVEYVILTVLSVALTIAVPLTVMHIVDHILPHAHGHYDDLFLFVGLLLIIFLVNAGINARRAFDEHLLGERMMMSLHGRLFEHLQRLSHNYHSRTTTSNLMALLTDDLREIRSAMGMVTGSAFYQVLLALGTAITVLVLDPLLGIIALIVVPVFAAGYVALRSRWQREAHAFQRLQGEADQLAHENLSAHAEIKAYGLQEPMIRAYHQRHHLMFTRHLRLANLGAGFESTLHVASGLGYVVIFGFGGYQVISEQGGVTLGVLFAFAHLLPLFYEPIERLADLGHTVEGAAGAFDRLDEVLEEPVRITDAPDATDFPLLADEIRLDHVTFGYDSNQPILKDLSLTIPAGADVAIVGPSGSGKSTVVNLIMRFWDPDGGRILFDGRDLRDGTVGSLRDQIGIVFPETFTFNTSVRENIAIGHPDATDAEVERAAREAQLDDYIRALPAGYNTVLGERGVRMSSGQRQRLAIARALVRNPRILIFDEATSAIDPQAEAEILDTLATIGHGRTMISIRHRMAAVAPADIIYVLDGGRLVEQGKHADLVKASGLYQRMYEEQMLYLHGGGVVRVGVDVNRLRLIPIFAELGTSELELVADRFMLERFAPNEVVVRQGDRGDKLYLVSRGELAVLADGPTEQHINTLGRGDFFGEMALLTNDPRSATVRTVTPTQLYSLSSEDFSALMMRLPDVRETIAQTADRRRMTQSD